jgi:hypothetical protein
VLEEYHPLFYVTDSLQQLIMRNGHWLSVAGQLIIFGQFKDFLFDITTAILDIISDQSDSLEWGPPKKPSCQVLLVPVVSEEKNKL